MRRQRFAKRSSREKPSSRWRSSFGETSLALGEIMWAINVVIEILIDLSLSLARQGYAQSGKHLRAWYIVFKERRGQTSFSTCTYTSQRHNCAVNDIFFRKNYAWWHLYREQRLDVCRHKEKRERERVTSFPFALILFDGTCHPFDDAQGRCVE